MKKESYQTGKKEQLSDADLEHLLAEMAKEGKLLNFILNLLEQADLANTPNISVNGKAIPLLAATPPISDKSCYKKCLKESAKPGGRTYSNCVKQDCKNNNNTISIDFNFVNLQ